MHEMTPTAEDSEIVELRGTLTRRRRFSVVVRESVIEIRVGMLFGRKPWILPNGSFRAGPPMSMDLVDEDWGEEDDSLVEPNSLSNDGGTDDALAQYLALPERATIGVAHLSLADDGPDPTVELDFGRLVLAPRINWFLSWAPQISSSANCLPDRRLLVSGVTMVERQPGQLVDALTRLGWTPGRITGEWSAGYQSGLLVEHAKSEAGSLLRRSRQAAIAAWLCVPLFFLIPILAVIGLGSLKWPLLAVLTVGVASAVSARTFRRRYWKALADRIGLE